MAISITKPTDGADDGTWGAKLNTALDTIVAGINSATPSDATTAAKGVVQLAGDLGGTATAPTVPGLAGKASTSHTHPVGDLTATGTKSTSTFLRGDNTWAIPPGSGGGTATYPRNPNPQAQNLKGWTFDALAVGSTKATTNASTLHFLRIQTPDSIAVANVVLALATAGAGLTYAAVGLYSSTGTLLGQTADQSTAFAGTAALLTIPLTGGPYTVGGGGVTDHVYVGIVTVGTTQPAFPVAPSNDATTIVAVNAGLTDGPRFGALGSQSTLPASVTPSSIAGLTNRNFWVAIS